MKLKIIYFIMMWCEGGKMSEKKGKYKFWRWLILTVLRFPKLYALTWGIIILLALMCMKMDIATLIGGLL